jgi:hypothetical protein
MDKLESHGVFAEVRPQVRIDSWGGR